MQTIIHCETVIHYKFSHFFLSSFLVLRQGWKPLQKSALWYTCSEVSLMLPFIQRIMFGVFSPSTLIHLRSCFTFIYTQSILIFSYLLGTHQTSSKEINPEYLWEGQMLSQLIEIDSDAGKD